MRSFKEYKIKKLFLSPCLQVIPPLSSLVHPTSSKEYFVSLAHLLKQKPPTCVYHHLIPAITTGIMQFLPLIFVALSRLENLHCFYDSTSLSHSSSPLCMNHNSSILLSRKLQKVTPL